MLILVDKKVGSMDEQSLKSRLSLAIEAACEAGELAMKYYRKHDLAVDRKADKSPVTQADREAELLLRKRVGAAFAEDGILGEEFGETAGSSGFRWIFDPIDGTKSFIHGVPLFGTLVGVEYDRRSVIGVMVLPALGEYLYAAQGQGAWHVQGSSAPQAARVSTTATLGEGLFCTTSVSGFEYREARFVYDQLRATAGLSRGWGDCFGYALVATGRCEAMVDPQMNVWDTACLQPILEEAGGTFTDWQGRPTIHGGEGVATNGHVLEEVLAITRQAKPQQPKP